MFLSKTRFYKEYEVIIAKTDYYLLPTYENVTLLNVLIRNPE